MAGSEHTKSPSDSHLRLRPAAASPAGTSPSGSRSNSGVQQQPWLSLDPQSDQDFEGIENAPDHQKARAIKAAFFAPSPGEGGPAAATAGDTSSGITTEAEDQSTYHSRPGGDIVSDIYNFVNEAEQGKSGSRGGRLVRSATFAGPDLHPSDDENDAPTEGYKDIMAPGGFRRNYLAHRHGQSEDEEAERGSRRSEHSHDTRTAKSQARRHTRSFVDFLAHSSGVSHLYGQDLEEYEEEEEQLPPEISERTALLKAHMDYRESRRGGDAPGDATVLQGLYAFDFNRGYMC